MPNRPDELDAIDAQDVKFKNKYGMGGVPDSPDPRDYDYKAVAAAGSVQALPDSVSLASILPKEIWNQEDYGACTSFAAHHLIAAARFKEGLPYQRPSWMATWYWTKLAMYGPQVAPQNVGCSIREAVMSTKRDGVAWENEWPYDAEHIGIPPNKSVIDNAQNYQSLYFFRVDDYEKGVDVDFLYRCLAEGWPVSVGIPVYDNFTPGYSDSVIPMPTGQNRIRGYHAVVIYGYALRGGNPYFRVRNQWGKDWGGRHNLPSGHLVEPGTCRIPVEFIRDLGFDCWTIRAVEDGKVQGVALEEAIPSG